jgi:hypothetical protein
LQWLANDRTALPHLPIRHLRAEKRWGDMDDGSAKEQFIERLSKGIFGKMATMNDNVNDKINPI